MLLPLQINLLQYSTKCRRKKLQNVKNLMVLTKRRIELKPAPLATYAYNHFQSSKCYWCRCLSTKNNNLKFLLKPLIPHLPEVESSTQGLKPRPRIQKNPRPRPRTALPRTDPLEAKDRNARGQEPRTQVQMFSKKSEKRSSKIIFRRTPN